MTDRTLTAPPSLTPLYAKAVLTGARRPARPSGQPSEQAFSIADQRIDRNHLTGYQRLCGYPVSDLLPPTYLHLLTFGLSVARMTEPDFPFALLGLVHVHNRITVHRPVTADEVLSLRAWAADLRPHPAGQQIDLVSEARVAGQAIWQERSSYMRRGPTPTPTEADRSTPAAKPPVAAQPDTTPARSVGSRWPVPADIGRRYAALSGDRNPIHLHPLTARAFGFPTAIAHGMWVLARTLSSVQNRLASSFVVDAAFKTPVLLPSVVELDTARTATGWQLQLHRVRDAKPHLAVTVAAGHTAEPPASDE